MPRRKVPSNESQEEAKVRKDLEVIANYPPRSDKTSWNRKLGNLETLVEFVRPIEDKMLILQKEARILYDQIMELREEMVQTCIHPYDHLVHKGDHIVCKFCDAKISIPRRHGKNS